MLGWGLSFIVLSYEDSYSLLKKYTNTVKSTAYVIVLWYPNQTRIYSNLYLLITKSLSVAEHLRCDKNCTFMATNGMQCCYEPCNMKTMGEQVLTGTWPLLSI